MHEAAVCTHQSDRTVTEKLINPTSSHEWSHPSWIPISRCCATLHVRFRQWCDLWLPAIGRSSWQRRALQLKWHRLQTREHPVDDCARTSVSTIAMASALVVLLLAHLVTHPVGGTYVHDDMVFEAQNATFLSSGAPAFSKCAAGPLHVHVRISTCFSVQEVQAIDNWVKMKLSGATPTHYIDGHRIMIDYSAHFVDSTTPCASNSIQSAEQPWPQYVAFLQPEPTTSSNPDAVLTFVKGDSVMAPATGSPGFQLQFRLCSSQCNALTTDLVLKTLADLNQLSPKSIARHFYCNEASGMGPVDYFDGANRPQCECGCPLGATFESGVCRSK